MTSHIQTLLQEPLANLERYLGFWLDPGRGCADIQPALCREPVQVGSRDHALGGPVETHEDDAADRRHVPPLLLSLGAKATVISGSP
jgi:hypothetical protein